MELSAPIGAVRQITPDQIVNESRSHRHGSEGGDSTPSAVDRRAKTPVARYLGRRVMIGERGSAVGIPSRYCNRQRCVRWHGGPLGVSVTISVRCCRPSRPWRALGADRNRLNKLRDPGLAGTTLPRPRSC